MRVSNRFQIISVVLAVVLVSAWFISDTGKAPKPVPGGVAESTAQSEAATGQRFSEKKEPARVIDAARLDREEAFRRVAGPYLKDGRQTPVAKLSAALDHHLTETRTLIDELTQAPAEKAPRLQQLLESKQAEFQTVREEVERWLEEQDLSRSKLARQVTDRFDQVENLIEGVVTESDPEVRSRIIVVAQQTLQRFQAPPVRLQGEPKPTFTQGTPTALTSDAIPDAPPPAYARPQGPEPSTAVVPKLPASSLRAKLKPLEEGLLGLLGISEALAAPPPATPGEASSCSYDPADLSSALPEVDVNDPDILALAEELDYSPLKMYSYIKNNIAFQPYYGSLKGAVGTLKSGSGNATDQTSLLIALFRASNIPARYVKGEIYFDADDPRYLEWLGVKTAQGAGARLAMGQVPKTYNNQFTHVWAEACIPYDNYRGSQSDNSGFHWIPLDPGFKKMAYTQGPTVSDIPGFAFDYASYLSTRTQTMPHEALRDQMEAALGEPLAHGGGYRGRPVREEIDILPGTLPYAVMTFKQWAGTTQSDVAALPAAHRLQAELELWSSGSAPLTNPFTVDMPELVGKRLTLSFQGATPADQTASTPGSRTEAAPPAAAPSRSNPCSRWGVPNRSPTAPPIPSISARKTTGCALPSNRMVAS